MPMYSEQIQTCPPGCHCSIHVQASGTIGPNRNYKRPNYRGHPYGRETPNTQGRESLYCHFCSCIGHTQNRCWQKYRHLRPQWKIDLDRAHGITYSTTNNNMGDQVPETQTQTRQFTATLAATMSAYQPVPNPVFPTSEKQSGERT